jgi:GTP-binding protein EngB required for normal cell division
MSAALEQLAADLAAVSFVPGTEAGAEHQQLLARARRLLEVKLRLEARRPADAPPVIVIAGGTNVGKSTVFNWVVGDTVASSSPLARHTKAPTIFVHTAEEAALCDGAFLPAYRRVTMQAPADATREPEQGVTSYFLKTHDAEAVKGVVLVDSPDIDSTHVNNRAVAEDLLFLADAVVFVTTPEKYNDELCVRYLRQALDLSKALTCVLNKGADAEVARDFREVVVPGLGGEVAVLTLPYVTPRPDPRTGDAYRGELQRLVLAPRGRGQALRRASVRGAAAWLGRDLLAVTARLREELSELDRVRSEVALALDARRDEYVRFLAGLEFYELDDVFLRVLEYFKIPVLDDVYDAFRGAIGLVTAGVTRVVTGRGVDGRSARQVKLDARAELDRQKVKELVEATRAEVLDVPFRYTGAVRDAAPGWIEGLRTPSVDEHNAEVEAFQRAAAGEAEAWIEREKKKHIELLEGHPYARNLLRALKGGFQIGFGLLSAKLTGGFGPWDVLIGTATERATKAVLERAGGVVHYQSLKTEFMQARARLFRDLLETAVAAPFLARLPRGVDPDRLARLEEAAAALRRGEVPA